MNNYGFAVYLSDEDTNELLPIITRLQQEYSDSPPFDPHISVHTAINTDLSTAIKIVERMRAGIREFSVENIGFGYQNKWSKILFIKIKGSEILTKIHNEISVGLSGFDPRPYTPHISLMYKNKLSTQKREKIISNLELPTRFSVKGIEIIGSETADSNWRNYSKWKVEYRKGFKQ